MKFNVRLFIQNLKNAIRENQEIDVGGGLFSGQELLDILEALENSDTNASAIRRETLEYAAIWFRHCTFEPNPEAELLRMAQEEKE